MPRRDNQRERQYAKANRKDMPRAEVLLWEHLRRKQRLGYAFRLQHVIGSFIADFACIKAHLILEVDGDSHSAEAATVYDQRRSDCLQDKGWSVMRFNNEDVFDNLDQVILEIDNFLQGVSDSPSARAAGTSPTAWGEDS